jgi:hypothetical protein
MGVSTFIGPIGKSDLNIDTSTFIEQVQNKWSNAKFHFITDPNAHSIMQWSVTINDNYILGDFFPTGIVYKGGDPSSDILLARLLRSIVPSEYRLFLWRENLSHEPIKITNTTTDADLVKGFEIPFDMTKTKYE